MPRRPNVILIIALTLTAVVTTVTHADTAPRPVAVANNTKFLLFNMQSLGQYDVRKNATSLPQANATSAGGLTVQEIVDTGDQIIITLSGIGTQPPIPPQQVQARETSPGCVTVSWQPNPESDIAGYVVYYGGQSVALGQVTTYANSVNVGTSTSHELCGFSPGTRYFAVRAFNLSDEFSGYSSERAVNVQGADTTPPAVISTNPADGATGVPIDAQVVIQLEDTQSGVDSNTVDVRINGALPDSRQFFGSPGSYTVVCEVSGGFSPQSTVNVTLQASDLASPSNSMSTSWSFTTGSNADTEAPIFCCLSPASGSTEVDPNSGLSFGVSDAGAGVDLTRLQFTVNGQFVLYSVSGDEHDAVISFSNPLGFTPGSIVQVSVTACDRSSAGNCASLDYSFSVATQAASFATAAVIVPDGYWVDDPQRALEVRNIPLGWTVRIFDTAGLVVRDFKNTMADGYTWSWDFTNDSGHAVARALYLIRVFNDGGDVQRSGRFVVQAGP